ncbi:MAG: hypothetical protein ACR2PL_12880 [Dehalococcoidia bacterium]
MPPIFLHMAMAADVAGDLPSAPLHDEQGTYLFGATTPDIRVITRRDRAETHYFDLNVFEHQDSVANFFTAHPELRFPEHLSQATVAFVGGYITHLALDETYIQQVYRPYFGQLSALGGDLSANTMDRILQYELDRRRRAQPERVQEIRSALENCSFAMDVGFLDSATLRRGREVATDQTRHPPNWERFRFQGTRHLHGLNVETAEAWERFRGTIPDLLQRTISHVSTAQVDAFLEQATERARRVLEQYLAITA